MKNFIHFAAGIEAIVLVMFVEMLIESGKSEEEIINEAVKFRDKINSLGMGLPIVLSHPDYDKKISEWEGKDIDELFIISPKVGRAKLKAKKLMQILGLAPDDPNAHDCDNCQMKGNCPIEDDIRILKMQDPNLTNSFEVKIKAIIHQYQKQNEQN